jgi:hypothetical protein
MAILSSTTIRLALIDYRASLIRLESKFPDVYGNGNHHESVYDIDVALMEIEGNCTQVSLTAYTCNPNK